MPFIFITTLKQKQLGGRPISGVNLRLNESLESLEYLYTLFSKHTPPEQIIYATLYMLPSNQPTHT